jgi:glycosyltransferase involved in cell wall biosynthesis
MFLFLKYIRPVWYYRLAYKTTASLLVDLDKIEQNELNLKIDDKYESREAIAMDCAYRAINSGIIPSPNSAVNNFEKITVNSISDNYRFLRKYFPIHWYIYVFIFRLVSFKNPLKETFLFLKHWRTKPSKSIQPEITKFSVTLEKYPFVSVVIPTLHRYSYLKDALADLEKQDYNNFEVIICDQSDPIDEKFYDSWKLDIKLIKQEEKALWLARNSCIQRAKGDFILLFDDDSRVEPDWIRNHLLCLQQFNCSISAGVTYTPDGHGLSLKEKYFHLSDVFDTGNAMVKREVFQKVGLFDRQFERQRMGDGEFGLRAILGGFQVISNPLARRIHLKGEKGGLREFGLWDAFASVDFRKPRPVPSTLYFSRKYFGDKDSIYWLMLNLPKSLLTHKTKKYFFAKIVSLILLPFILPLVLYQHIVSWNISTKMLLKGQEIE